MREFRCSRFWCDSPRLRCKVRPPHLARERVFRRGRPHGDRLRVGREVPLNLRGWCLRFSAAFRPVIRSEL